jgi:spore germination protein
MEIYVIQEGDTIDSIAARFGIPAQRIILDNGLSYPIQLLVGQALIIAFPKQTHVVQEGDTLQSIAELNQVPVMQLLRNNSFLADRDILYPGETLIISYNTDRSITTNGYVFTFIKRENLIRVLPNLTYLSIYNYTASEHGEVVQYGDDTEIISTSLDYGVIPLLMVTTMTPTGVPNIEAAYNILLNEEVQNVMIEQFVTILKSKGYRGINMVFNYINQINLQLYINMIKRVSERIRQEGLLFFTTIDYGLQEGSGDVTFDQIDYSAIGTYVDNIIFLKFIWGANYGPPAPVSNINHVRRLVEYMSERYPPEKIMVGVQIFGYDWQLPYLEGRTVATSMTINAVLELAYESAAVIQFDEESLTPFFYYYQIIGIPVEHVVWFIDVRSIEGINQMVRDFSLQGSGIWNIMFYYPQLWTSINAQFDIIKLL